MKAMIFAAGLGTRMKPFTDTIPKALVEVDGRTLLEIQLRNMHRQGIRDIIVNVHHFAGQIRNFLAQNQNFGLNITISDEQDQLLDTGGGLLKASGFFNDGKPFVVQNVDVISDVSYADLHAQITNNHALAVLSVSSRNTSRYFLFNNEMQLCGWQNESTGEKRIMRESQNELKKFAFSGIHIIEPEIFSLISLSGKFSMVDVYLSLAASQKIVGIEHSAASWVDVGKPGNLAKACEIFRNIGL